MWSIEEDRIIKLIIHHLYYSLLSLESISDDKSSKNFITECSTKLLMQCMLHLYIYRRYALHAVNNVNIRKT